MAGSFLPIKCKVFLITKNYVVLPVHVRVMHSRQRFLLIVYILFWRTRTSLLYYSAYFNGVDWRLLVELVFEALLALGTEFENPSIDSISYKQKKSRCMDENRLDEPNHLHLFLSLARVRIWKERSAREVQRLQRRISFVIAMGYKALSYRV